MRLQTVRVDDLPWIDSRHVDHRFCGSVAIHDHSGWHDRAADVAGRETEVHPVRGRYHPGYDSEHRDARDCGKLRPRNIGIHRVTVVHRLTTRNTEARSPA